MSETTERQPADDFMEVVNDHMDLDFEEKRFLHEQAHNIYNKGLVKGSRLERRRCNSRNLETV